MNILYPALMAVSPFKVAVAASVMTLVGILWYSQPLFGRAFIRLSGIRPGDLRPEHVRRNAIVSFVTSLFMAILLGMIYHLSFYQLHEVICATDPCYREHMPIPNARMLFGSAAVIWVFIMLNQLNGFLFRREPVALFLLTTLRTLLMLLAGSAVFVLWK